MGRKTGPKELPWAVVEKQYGWFLGYRYSIAMYGNTTGHIWKLRKD